MLEEEYQSLDDLVSWYGTSIHKRNLGRIKTALSEAQKTPTNSTMDAIALLRRWVTDPDDASIIDDTCSFIEQQQQNQ